MEFKSLQHDEINTDLFKSFVRRQEVTKCWRKVEDKWVIKDIAFIDDWDEDDFAFLVKCLRTNISTGGVVFGAFADDVLKGFASVRGIPVGTKKEYLDLSSIHASADMRGQGIGRSLFELAAHWARERGAEKLYISSHSAVESQAFYKAMGCVEAMEYDKAHVEEEPCDCQLEYVL